MLSPLKTSACRSRTGLLIVIVAVVVVTTLLSFVLSFFVLWFLVFGHMDHIENLIDEIVEIYARCNAKSPTSCEQVFDKIPEPADCGLPKSHLVLCWRVC